MANQCVSRQRNSRFHDQAPPLLMDAGSLQQLKPTDGIHVIAYEEVCSRR